MSKEKLKIENCSGVFAFVLGREQKIALAELESVLRRFGICFDILSVQDNIALIKIVETQNSKLKTQNLINFLGGTIKIFEIVNLDYEKTGLSSNILDLISSSKDRPSGKLDFGVSDYSKRYAEAEINRLGHEVKNGLKRLSISSRHVAVKGTRELSTIQTIKNKLDRKGIEIGVFNFASDQKESMDSSYPLRTSYYSLPTTHYLLGRLIAVSNPEEWGERDYGKPAGDKYSGMMPPKLARMLVNLALGSTEEQKSRRYGRDPDLEASGNLRTEEHNNVIPAKAGIHSRIIGQKPLVVDPFCGSGNILMEAVLLDCDILGSDISERAVEDTKANLNWLMNNEERIMNNGSSKHNSSFIIHDSVYQADAISFDFAKKLQAKKLCHCHRTISWQTPKNQKLKSQNPK